MVGQLKYKYKGNASVFDAGTNILTNGTLEGVSKITKLGVQAPRGVSMNINGRPIIVGYTGIYELPEGIDVTSFYFNNISTLQDVLVDYVAE